MCPCFSCKGYGEIFRKAVSVQHRNLSLDKGRQVIRHFPGDVVALWINPLAGYCFFAVGNQRHVRGGKLNPVTVL